MTITKQTIIDQVSKDEHGNVLYRTATRIMEGGVQISQSFHRASLTPGQDLTGIPAEVAAICNVVWTPEVIAAYAAAQEAIAV